MITILANGAFGYWVEMPAGFLVSPNNTLRKPTTCRGLASIDRSPDSTFMDAKPLRRIGFCLIDEYQFGMSGFGGDEIDQ